MLGRRSMNVAILSLGTRGDVEIFMALAELKVLTGGTSASAVKLLRDAVKAAVA